MIRTRCLLLAACCLLFATACATDRPTLFSGKPVVEFDQGQMFLTYIKLNRLYAVYKYQMTEACAAKAIPEATCAAMRNADSLVTASAAEIEQALATPKYPLDMAKVQAFIDLTLTTLMRVGVKGLTGGIAP